MSNRYAINNLSSNVHFSHALMPEAEYSRMTAKTRHLTTFNAGDIVPIYCQEILPDESLSIDVNFVIRQTTLMTPTMDNMHVDLYAFWVPNRIVNQSWKAVQGENYSGSWVAPDVSLVPLVQGSTGSTQIPVGSVADYYGFPTQQPIPNSVLSQCHDLKFRGYIMIYNEHFRDQNYQPPIPLSTLNVFQGFFVPSSSGSLPTVSVLSGTAPSGSVGAGAIANSIYGSSPVPTGFSVSFLNTGDRFHAYDKPLKANKLHDYFTSVLPSPQKSSSPVLVPVNVDLPRIPVSASTTVHTAPLVPLRMINAQGGTVPTGLLSIPTATGAAAGAVAGASIGSTPTYGSPVTPNNLWTNATSLEGAHIDISDIRMSSAIQQVYETLARGGSRYRSIVASFFGIDVDDPFCDVPACLGHISRDLDLYQTAQTSSSSDGSTPQGNLAAFGYTANGGHLFNTRFVEHGYVHIFAVVRHRNVYPSYLGRDNFRLTMLDFYTPPMANLSEQPVYTREINPFTPSSDNAFGYQEAWAEYRFEPDRVTGLMRTMPTGTESLAVWNYADDFDDSLIFANSNWLKSNSEEVLNRTLAVTSDLAPQFKASFLFNVDKTLPMPTYSVPGMDII